ncbi:ABC transporter substrate-binding protein [Lacrimispora sp.]|uniref:ABC transporter substrate-binding protein n=1 Tax=Lacrimispora sp. TaxID=2719234 RepID=UPI003993FBB4
MRRRTAAAILALSMVTGVTGCTGNTKTEVVAETAVTKTEGDGTRMADGQADPSGSGQDKEPVTINFWHRDGNTTSNPMFEVIIKDFEEKYPWITVEYTGLAADSYMTKYNTAIVTGETPDVCTISNKDVYTLAAQDALLELDGAFDQWEEKERMLPQIIESARFLAGDGKLYMLGYGMTQETSWYNKTWHEEQGIEPAETIDELVEYCKRYADKENGEYYFTLRGGSGSAENLFMFIMSYAGVTKFFNEDGTSTLSDSKIAEGLDVYANLYKEGLVSVDAISNGYKEMVAEFGSGTAKYMMHNSSSVAENEKNLGEGNVMAVKPLAGKDGIAVCKAPSFMGSAVFKNTGHPEEAVLFAQYLASAEGAGYADVTEGRVPVNTGVYEQEWYDQNPYYKVYAQFADQGVQFAEFPVWLDGYNEYAKTNITADFQAVLHGDKDSKAVCEGWAKDLTEMQKEYLSR